MEAVHILGAAMVIVLFGTLAGAQDVADEFLGEWYSEDNESKILVEKKNDKYFGTIIWLSEPTYGPGDDEIGAAKHDRNNRDKSLRARPIVGLTVLSNFSYNAKKAVWAGGKIYDPENGKQYKCVIRVSSEANNGRVRSLQVRGFVGISALGRTTIWNRVPQVQHDSERG